MINISQPEIHPKFPILHGYTAKAKRRRSRRNAGDSDLRSKNFGLVMERGMPFDNLTPRNLPRARIPPFPWRAFRTLRRRLRPRSGAGPRGLSTSADDRRARDAPRIQP